MSLACLFRVAPGLNGSAPPPPFKLGIGVDVASADSLALLQSGWQSLPRHLG